jgi:phosphatidylglycerophosphatase A
LKHAPDDFVRPKLDLADRVALVIATGFGAGYVPVAPGTAGTLVAVPFFLAVARMPASLQVLTTLAFIGLAIHCAERAGRFFGASDDGHIVSDEIAGYLVTMLLVPPTPGAMLVGFVLFRILDQVKPWPASWFDQKVHTGLGNVMDDVAAALYGRAGMALFVWLWP